MHTLFSSKGDSILVDIGDSTGTAIHISTSGWEVIARPPVLFRRTGPTFPLPRSQKDRNVGDPFSVINASEEMSI